jgi:hypothetical protein
MRYAAAAKYGSAGKTSLLYLTVPRCRPTRRRDDSEQAGRANRNREHMREHTRIAVAPATLRRAVRGRFDPSQSPDKGHFPFADGCLCRHFLLDRDPLFQWSKELDGMQILFRQGESAVRTIILCTLRGFRVLLFSRKSFNHAPSLLGEPMQQIITQLSRWHLCLGA